MRLGHGDGWPDVVAGCQVVGEDLSDKSRPRGRATRCGPARSIAVGADLVGRRSVGQVGTVVALERAPPLRPARDRRCKEPLWVPITLRCARVVVVPTIGPRSSGVSASQTIWRRHNRPNAESAGLFCGAAATGVSGHGCDGQSVSLLKLSKKRASWVR